MCLNHTKTHNFTWQLPTCRVSALNPSAGVFALVLLVWPAYTKLISCWVLHVGTPLQLGIIQPQEVSPWDWLWRVDYSTPVKVLGVKYPGFDPAWQVLPEEQAQHITTDPSPVRCRAPSSRKALPAIEASVKRWMLWEGVVCSETVPEVWWKVHAVSGTQDLCMFISLVRGQCFSVSTGYKSQNCLAWLTVTCVSKKPTVTQTPHGTKKPFRTGIVSSFSLPPVIPTLYLYEKMMYCRMSREGRQAQTTTTTEKQHTTSEQKLQSKTFLTGTVQN